MTVDIARLDLQMDLLESPPATWHAADVTWTNHGTGEGQLLHRALNRARAAGWTRLGPWRWSRPYTPPSRNWTPGGQLIVDWESAPHVELTYRAPSADRSRPLMPWAYCWTDSITIRSVRSGLAVLVALDLLDPDACRMSREEASE